MAPPRKQKRAPTEGYEVKLRLPPDTMARIETKAKAEQRPLNAIIRNELARVPDLEQVAKLGEQVREMEILLTRFGMRQTWNDLSLEMEAAIDQMMGSTGSARETAIDRIIAIRKAMLATKKANR
jgi:Cu/Ag efflux pump CusA